MPADTDAEQLRAQLEAERRMAALTRRFLALQLEEIDEGLQEGLAAAAHEAGADQAQLSWLDWDGPGLPTVERHLWSAPGVCAIEPNDEESISSFRWFSERFLAGEVVNLTRLADLPAEAAAERDSLRQRGTVSYLGVPILWRGRMAGSLDLRSTSEPRAWSALDVERLKLMGEVLLSVLRRRDAQIARREAADRFDAMADSVQVALVESDTSGRIVYASPRLPEMLGHPIEETIGTRLSDLVHPDDRESLRLTEEASCSADTETRLFRAVHRDGSCCHVEAIARRYESQAGERRTITLLRDVSVQTARNADLELRLQLESALSDLSRRILSTHAAGIDELIHSGLESVATVTRADRAFLLSLSELRRKLPSFFEWCREGAVQSITPSDQDGERYPGFLGRLLAGQAVSIPEVAELDDEFAAEREAMLAAGIRSYLLVPALSRGRLMGILGVHCVHQSRQWSEHEITLLRLVADLFTGALRRKRNETALSASEARFRAMAENSQDSICELSDAGQILYASPAFARLVELPRTELEGTDVFGLVHRSDAEALTDFIGIAARGRVDRAVVFRITRGGDWLEVEATARSYSTALEEPRLVAVLRDVSTRERDRRALEHQVEGEQKIAELSRFFLDLDATHTEQAIQSKLALAAELAGAERSWLYSIDPRGDQPMRRCGWSAEGVSLSFPPGERHPDDDWRNIILRAGRALQVPRLADLPPERRAQMQTLADRGVRSFLGIPLLSAGQLVGLMGFEVLSRERSWSNEQVTLLQLVGEIFVSALRREQAEAELERSQMQLLQSQKMEAVGTLAGGIAHDFNNHLAVMLGNARFIADSTETPDPELRDALDDIQRSAEHCAQLTRSLLAFSRRSPVTIQAIEVGEILETVSDLVRPLLPSSISFRSEAAEPEHAVRADPTQLRQVLINLVVNARDAMPSGGRLALGARRRRVGERQASAIGLPRAGEYVQISVSDDGSGIPAAIRDRVFEPFFTTKELGQGTGLGLATAYGIVQQCGGSMEVESEPGNGTIFRVLLPLAEAASPSLDAVASVDPGEGSETLLLVEDEPAVRRLLARTLRARGFSVIEAPDGQAGLAAAHEAGDEVDLLITDLVMPHMGGLELASKLQTERPELRVLFLSGHAGPEVGADADSVRNARFLQKPFRDDDLLREVRHLLGVD